MAQIKSKQIKLAAQGDLIIGDVGASGTPLTVGTVDQILISNLICSSNKKPSEDP